MARKNEPVEMGDTSPSVAWTCILVVLSVGLFRCSADALNESPSPKSPRESLADLHGPAGFEVGSVAGEPLIESPSAFEWGADGKLWVVEMLDYPSGAFTNETDENGTREPASNSLTSTGRVTNHHRSHDGRIVFLESTNNDGVLNKTTVFLDGLSYPNSVFPWRRGAIVSADSEIFYAECTNGSGRANLRKTILSGFYPGNPQHRVNGFDYGLDNWLYAANGDSGGRIRSVATGQDSLLGSCDFRFRPDTGEFDLQAGCTQYGRHRDDWGTRAGKPATGRREFDPPAAIAMEALQSKPHSCILIP